MRRASNSPTSSAWGDRQGNAANTTSAPRVRAAGERIADRYAFGRAPQLGQDGFRLQVGSPALGDGDATRRRSQPHGRSLASLAAPVSARRSPVTHALASPGSTRVREETKAPRRAGSPAFVDACASEKARPACARAPGSRRLPRRALRGRRPAGAHRCRWSNARSARPPGRARRIPATSNARSAHGAAAAQPALPCAPCGRAARPPTLTAE